MAAAIRSGGASMTTSSLTGSWISTVCQGSPVRRSLERLVANRWVHLAAWHGSRGGLASFAGGQFVAYVPESDRLPTVPRSVDWFAGHRGHLPPVRTAAALGGGLR